MHGGRWFFQTHRTGSGNEEYDGGTASGTEEGTVQIRQEGNKNSEIVDFNSQIWERYLPHALSIGIPYETFWHLNPRKLEPFARAHDMRRQELMTNMWQMGQYVAAAMDATVCNTMPFTKRRRKGKYPEEPIRILPKTEEEKRQDEDRELEKMISFLGVFEKDVKSKSKDR